MIPSVSEVAEAAEVSRATAYRYFPSQAAMIQEAVDQALGPILEWTSDSAGCRGADLRPDRLRLSAHGDLRGDAQGRAAAGDRPVGARQAGTLGDEAARRPRQPQAPAGRGAQAAEAASCASQAFDRLTQSLSLVFGTEALVVLKDIWGLDGERGARVAVWASFALVRAAIAGRCSGDGGKARSVRTRRTKTRRKEKGQEAE